MRTDEIITGMAVTAQRWTVDALGSGKYGRKWAEWVGVGLFKGRALNRAGRVIEIRIDSHPSTRLYGRGIYIPQPPETFRAVLVEHIETTTFTDTGEAEVTTYRAAYAPEELEPSEVDIELLFRLGSTKYLKLKHSTNPLIEWLSSHNKSSIDNL
jgi:hypothetical protein